MRINTNISALAACYQLDTSDKKQATSIERLSSGYKLNSPKDNPVGSALSIKMKAQIRGLDRATQNTSDGISVIQTAEGVLGEIQAMVQRMGELSVQAASDTNTPTDRESIMKEIDEIRDEIDRVSKDTDFNTKTLLDGSLSRRTFTNTPNAKVAYVSEAVEAGRYVLMYTNTSSQAQLSTGAVTSASLPGGSIRLNALDVSVEQGESLSSVYDKLRDAGEKVGVDVTYTGSLTGSASFTFTSKEYGSDILLDISTSGDMATALGLSNTTVSARGTDATFTPEANGGLTSGMTIVAEGNTAIIKGAGGFEMRVDVTDSMAANASLRVVCGITENGPMIIQAGANEGQEIKVDIPEVTSETLGIDKLHVYTERGASEAIDLCGKALAYISDVRSKLGAYQNRMDHTVSNLDVTTENLTAALSRIVDVDMAKEMTNYTTLNVITQAATSMLAQANQAPEKILQLLQ